MHSQWSGPASRSCHPLMAATSCWKGIPILECRGTKGITALARQWDLCGVEYKLPLSCQKAGTWFVLVPFATLCQLIMWTVHARERCLMPGTCLVC
jgi:hypothetical protein